MEQTNGVQVTSGQPEQPSQEPTSTSNISTISSTSTISSASNNTRTSAINKSTITSTVNNKSSTKTATTITTSTTTTAAATTTTSRAPLYNGPKLFAKPTVKTNLVTIQKAISKALEGAANAENLKRMQAAISKHSETCDHFLILFRSRHQFRGLYQYSEKKPSQQITKLDGIGPKNLNNEDIVKYYKFDSPKRQFTEVQTRHISLTIIAFTIQDHLWMRPLSARVSTKSESQPH